jgi:hypothetical protein
MRSISARLKVRLVCWLTAGAILGACSSSTDSGGGGGGGGPEIPDEERYAALEAVTTKIDGLVGTDADSRRAELLDFLESREEFEASGVNDDGSLWARFTDGRLLLFIANRDELPEFGIQPAIASTPSRAAARRGPPAGIPAASAARMAAPAELPASTQARVLGGGEGPTHSFFTGFIPYLSAMLEAGGYQIAASGAATIEALLNVSGDGVFYLGSHGGWGTNAADENTFGVMTATTFSLRNDSAYAALWLDSSLIYTVPLTPGIRPPFHRCEAPCMGYYGITAKFVTKHMGRFADGSLVYLGACSSFDAGFRDAFIAKNAGVYFGWTAPFHADDDSKATYYLFDRLMGLNDPIAPLENPRQRPFDYVSVHNDMARPARGLTTSATATLTYKAGSTESGLLAPTIERADVEESTGLLVLKGKFGSDPRSSGGGEVSINSRSTGQLQIESWGKEEIRARLPLTGESSAGDVVVWNRGRKSNARRLSQWKLTSPSPAPLIPLARRSGSMVTWPWNLQFLTGEGTLKWEGGVDLHIRVDLSSYREQAGDQPKYRVVPFQIAADSRGELEASGTNGSDSWSGTAQITTRLANPAAPNVVDGVGELEPELHLMRLALYITVTQGLTGTNEGGITYDIPAVWGSNDGPLNPVTPLPSLYLPLNSDFGIIGDQRRQVPEDPSSILYWSDLIPEHIPADTLPR